MIAPSIGSPRWRFLSLQNETGVWRDYRRASSKIKEVVDTEQVQTLYNNGQAEDGIPAGPRR